MDIYTDYANWKFENYDFISALVKGKSKSIARFTQVIAVVDYLYEKRVETGVDLDETEEIIFESGFEYIHNHFMTLQNIWEKNFDKNLPEMEKLSKTINLLLYVNDFQNEILNSNDDITNDVKKLDDFEEQVLDYIEKKENAPDTMFALLDDITIPMFERHNVELYTTEQIFYDIAIEYGIFQDNDYDAFNDVLSKIAADKDRG